MKTKSKWLIAALVMVGFGLNAQTWNPIGSGLSQDTCHRTISVTDGNAVYVADFYYSGLGKLVVRKWDGSGWNSLPTVNGVVGNYYNGLADIAVYKGNVYVAMLNSFEILKYNGTSWSTLTVPSPGQSNSVTFRTLEVYNGDLIIGGRFYLNDGAVNYDNIMKYDGSNFIAMPGLSSVVPNITDIHVMNGQLYCQAGKVYKWDGSSWNAWGAVPSPPGSYWRGHLMSYNNELYYAGYNDGNLHKIGQNTATLVTTLPFKIQDMDVYNNELYIVGDSTLTGTSGWPWVIGGGLVKYDGQSFTTVSAPTAIRTGVVYNGELHYFSSSTLTHNGVQHDRAFKMNGVLGINDFTDIKTGLSVYPNPAHGVFFIENTLNQKQEVKLTNSTGQVVRNISLQPEMKAEVRTESLSPGMYFIDNGSNAQRIIITP